MKPLILIPARMAASRLPGKPLADIAGRAMVLRVLDLALAADLGPVAVAAAEAEVADLVRDAGGRAVLTDPDLPSGSDRVFAAAQALDPDGRHDVVINLQGDLPALPIGYLQAVLEPLRHSDSCDIGTLVAPVTSAEEARAEQVVKAVCAFGPGARVARALYFSRACVPWSGAAEGWRQAWHHLGLYAYRREALARFVRLPPGRLERLEKLEQLRALEAGMQIGCARVEAAPFGVDTPEDLERIRAHFRERGLP